MDAGITWTYEGQIALAEGSGFQVQVFPAAAGGGWNGRIRYIPAGHEEIAHYGSRGEGIEMIERQLRAEHLVAPIPEEMTP